MKKIGIFLIVALCLFAYTSCDKKSDTANHFSYNSKDYLIDTAILYEWVSGAGTADEHTVYQFGFLSINETDTTGLLLAVYDTATNTLSGNYPAVSQMDIQNNSRAIIPFGFVFGSGVLFPGDIGNFTGNGGSVDISVKSGIYSINFNQISAGSYNQNMDAYSEISTISGSFNGSIASEIVPLDKKRAVSNPLVQKIFKLSKK